MKSKCPRLPRVTSAFALLAICGCDASQIVPQRGTTWSVSSQRDPMTDATVHSATAVFSGDRYNVEVQVDCNQAQSGPRVTYNVTSFERDGQPAEMRAVMTDYGLSQSLEARADNETAFQVWNRNPRFNNRISIGEGSSFVQEEPAGTHLARAARIAFRLSLLTGDETIEFSQQDDALQGVLNPCLEEFARLRQAEERLRHDRQLAAQQNKVQQEKERLVEQQQHEDRSRQEQQTSEQRLLEQRLAHEQSEREQQESMCEQIRRTGTTDQGYLRSQGCG